MCDGKFCFRFSLEKRCFILGFITFFLSLGMVATSAAMLVVRRTSPDDGYFTSLSEIFSDKVLDILLPTIIVLGLLWMGFSVLLGLGIRKYISSAVCIAVAIAIQRGTADNQMMPTIYQNTPSLVLSYFMFSAMLIIVLLTGALLLLLDFCWTLSLALFLLSIVYICCTMMVHAAYDQMQVRCGFYERQSSESAAILVDEEENY